MIREVDAVYRDGVFVPNEPFSLPNRSQVRLIVQAPESPEPSGPADARAMLDEMIERMRRSSVAPAAFPISRDDLYERR